MRLTATYRQARPGVGTVRVCRGQFVAFAADVDWLDVGKVLARAGFTVAGWHRGSDGDSHARGVAEMDR